MGREGGPSAEGMGIDMGPDTKITESIEKKDRSGVEKAEISKSYCEERRINSAHFVVEWDEGYQEYVIDFPDVDTSNRKEIPDEVLRISDKIEDAQQVLERAVQLAQIDLPTWESDDPDKDVLEEIKKFITTQNY